MRHCKEGKTACRIFEHSVFESNYEHLPSDVHQTRSTVLPKVGAMNRIKSKARNKKPNVFFSAIVTAYNVLAERAHFFNACHVF